MPFAQGSGSLVRPNILNRLLIVLGNLLIHIDMYNTRSRNKANPISPAVPSHAQQTNPALVNPPVIPSYAQQINPAVSFTKATRIYDTTTTMPETAPDVTKEPQYRHLGSSIEFLQTSPG